jgi:hypothetical protein
MKILLGQMVLARGLAHRESPRQFSLATRRETQAAATLRVSEATVFDRGNAHAEVKFTIARRHDSAECALRFAATHPQCLAQASGGLIFVSEDGSQIAEIFMPDAVLRTLHCVPTGLVTNTAYEFIGGGLTTQPPPS